MRILLQDLQPSTLYLVQLRSADGTGRFSEWSRQFELRTVNETTPPAPPTGLNGVFSQGNLSFSWVAPTLSADGSALEDLKDYEVTINPVPADPNWRPVVFYTEATAVEFTREDNIAAFGTFRPNIRVEVRARDILDNASTPATKDFLKARPNPVTGLAWASIRDAFSGSWTAPTANTDGTVLDDLIGYDVRIIYAATNVAKYTTTTPQFTFSYEQNKATFGGVDSTAKTPLTIEVRAMDSVGQLSDPVSLQAGNPPPAKPTGVAASAVSEGIRVTWAANPDDDLIAYEIWSAPDLTTAGTLYGRVSPSQREYIHQTVAYNQDHYLYVTAVDEFNSRSPDSDRTGPHRPKSPFTVDTTPPAATTLTTATPARASTDPAAVALTWTAVTDSDLAGYHIRYSKNTATREWLYHDVIDKAATTTTIEGLASNTVYVFQIRSYDTMINPSAWSAEVLGTSSVSQLKEVATEVQVVAGGVLRSANFNETNQTGWRLMDSGLDILSGRVNARVVSAGTLISTQTVNIDGTVQPAWSLNLAGNASLNDVQVRGKIVVGAGTGAAAVNIASANYGGTGHQWAIKGDGTVDLRHGGATASNVTIDSTGIRGRDGGGNQRFILNTSGQFHLSTTNGGVVFDDNGLRIYSGATVMVDLNRSGSATFEGTVRASAGGHIGGWTINPGYGMYAGNLNLRSDLGMIYSGDTTARVAMRAGYGFWAGHNDHASAPFRVHTDGSLVSSKGTIGGWTINPGSLSGSGQISGGTIISPRFMSANANKRFELIAGDDVIRWYRGDNGEPTGQIRANETTAPYMQIISRSAISIHAGQAVAGFAGAANQTVTIGPKLNVDGGISALNAGGYIDAGGRIYSSDYVEAYNAIYDRGNWVYSARNPPPLPSHTHSAGQVQVVRGTLSRTPDANGYTSFPHGLGYTPAAVTLTGVSPYTGSAIPVGLIAYSKDATTVFMRCLNQSGGVITTAITFSYVCVG